MIKRFLDIVVSGTLLLVLAPMIGLLAILVRLNLGSPILFAQIRPGRGGRPFRLIKFRTMRDTTDECGNLLPDHVRLTGFGRWLRATSLDELPELWNILRGEMSLVGPRPLLMEYLPMYSARQFRRHEVRPGLTGWAQINGRNALSWEQRFEHDVWYVEHQSLWLDLKIAVITFVKVLRADGVTETGHATMTPFRGSATCQNVATSRSDECAK